MSREDKEQFVKDMRHDVQRAAGAIFVDYTGLTVSQADSFRRKVREISATYRVVKNTLMTRALEGTPFANAASYLKGTPTGVILGFEDPVTPAKLTFEFLKDCEQMKIKGGIVDSKAITPKEVEALSQLPSKAELQAAVVGLALSPGRNLAGQLKNPAGRIVGAIEALIEKLEG